MKSKRVEEMIAVMQEDYPEIFDKEIADELIAQFNRVVTLAEQDAEERAVAVAEDFFKEWKDVPIQDWMITEFKQKLNGGQSDECNE